MGGKKYIFLTIATVLALTILGVFVLVLLPERVLLDPELSAIPESIDEPVITFIDPIRGSEDAKITIVEYGDFACPLCQSIEPDIATLIAEAPRQRRLIWKDAPNVAIHPEAFTLAQAARCGQDQGKFWEFHDALLGSSLNPNASQLRTIAENLGIDGETFTACMASGVTRPVVEHTLDEAVALDIASTPAIFINGVLYEGPLTLTGLREYIEEL